MKALPAAVFLLSTALLSAATADAGQSRPLFLRRHRVVPPDPATYAPIASVVPGLPAPQHDPLPRTYTFAAARTLVLVPGFSQVKIGDDTLTLSRPVVSHSGRLYIPMKDVDRLKAEFGRAARTAATGAVAFRHTGRRVVVIDPGHGAHDPGAVANGVREKDVNLSIALRLKTLLTAKGFSVTMTRSTDRFIELEERAAIANRAQADYFISIHANSEPSHSVSGVEVFYCDTDSRYDPIKRGLLAARGYKLDALKLGLVHQPCANILKIVHGLLVEDARWQSRKLAEIMCREVAHNATAASRGAKPGPFRVLRHSNCPAVLIETGFLSNRPEAKRLADPGHQKKIAEGIAAALSRYDAARCD